jgi:hypothetical protein
MSKEELNTLRKLGLTQEEIARINPNTNPFKDYSLGNHNDF